MAGLQDFLQGASNSVASNVSAPVDGLAWLLRKAGVPIPSNPVGGSDWMAQQGFTREPESRGMGLLGEAIGGVVPMLVAAKAPQIARGLLQMGENAAAQRTMNTQAGKVFVYPQDKALATAQRNAALPIDQGGLGLGANNTPMERAQAMGFDTGMPLYHGTGADIRAFDPRMAGKNDRGLWGRGQYLATSPDSASSYALREGDGANVIPAYAAVKRPMQVTTGKDLITRMPDGTDTRALIGDNLDGAKIKEIAKNAGHDGVFQVKPNGNVGDIVTFDPSAIRSRFAAFDPMRRNEADILGRADPELLKYLAGAGLLGVGGYNAMSDKP